MKTAWDFAMIDFKTRRNLASGLITAFALSIFAVPQAFGDGVVSSPVPLPPAKPRVDQLGQMEGVPSQQRFMLAAGLFLQAIACVAVAIALAGHLSLPPKKG